MPVYCKKPVGKCRDSGDLLIVPSDRRHVIRFSNLRGLIAIDCQITLLASSLKHQILGGLRIINSVQVLQGLNTRHPEK
jgi:hypothetical protein